MHLYSTVVPTVWGLDVVIISLTFVASCLNFVLDGISAVFILAFMLLQGTRSDDFGHDDRNVWPWKLLVDFTIYMSSHGPTIITYKHYISFWFHLKLHQPPTLPLVPLSQRLRCCSQTNKYTAFGAYLSYLVEIIFTECLIKPFQALDFSSSSEIYSHLPLLWLICILCHLQQK